MIRILLAVAIGAVLAVGATFLTSAVVLGVANGAPNHAAFYVYGTR